MLKQLIDSSRHLTSYGFARSYQQSVATSSNDGGVIAWAGSKAAVPTLFITCPTKAEDCGSFNRVCTPEIPAGFSGFKFKKREEYVTSTATPGHLRGKALYNEMTAPLQWAERQGLEFTKMTELSDGVRDLWLDWSMDRLASGLMITNFPTSRNLRCFEDANDSSYVSFELRKGGKTYAARVLQLGQGIAFDLAFIGDRRHPHAFRALRNLSMDWLARNGYASINLGETTGKGLTFFKERLGAEVVHSWQGEREIANAIIPPTFPKKAKVRLSVPVKDHLRAKFAQSQRWRLKDLLTDGHSLVNVMTAFNDLKNPKYASGPCMVLKLLKDGDEVWVEDTNPSPRHPSPVLVF